MIRCATHPDEPSRYDCASCARHMCRACSNVGDGGFVCGGCLARQKAAHRKGLAYKALFGAFFVLPLSAAIVGVIAYSWATYEPPFDYGAKTPTIDRYQAAVQKRPCTSDTIIVLGEEMIDAGDYVGAGRAVDAWLADCGENERVRWLTYGAYKRSGDLERAAADATILIAADPADPDYRWWRGIVLEQAGDLAGAARDYRQTLILSPEMSSIPFNLADAYGGSGRPCDGLHPLRQYAWFTPGAASMSNLLSRIGRLSKEGRCLDGLGKALVAPDGEGTLRAVVFVAQITAEMEVDPDLTFVVLDSAFAANGAVVQDREDPVVVPIDGDLRDGWTGRAASIALGDAVAHDVPVLIVEGLGREGVIGQSWLTRFEGAREADGLRLRAYR